MENILAAGDAGPVAARPKDSVANPPAIALPPPGPSEMQQHYLSQEDKIALRFNKTKQAKAMLTATRQELEKLTAFGDTVTMDDIVDAAGGMVAAGVPAVQVATKLAEVPEQQSQMQGWVAEQLQKLAPIEAQVNGQFAQEGYSLGLSSMKSIMASSADEFFSKQALTGETPVGRA